MRRKKDYSGLCGSVHSFKLFSTLNNGKGKPASTKKKEPTLNYDIVFASTVSSVNSAIIRYKKCQTKAINLPLFMNDNGDIVMGSSEYMKKLAEEEKDALADINRLMKDISFLKQHETDIREGRCFI